MVAHISTMYAEHHDDSAAGIFKTEQQHPLQINNRDEIGFDPTGKWSCLLLLQVGQVSLHYRDWQKGTVLGERVLLVVGQMGC